MSGLSGIGSSLTAIEKKVGSALSSAAKSLPGAAGSPKGLAKTLAEELKAGLHGGPSAAGKVLGLLDDPAAANDTGLAKLKSALKTALLSAGGMAVAAGLIAELMSKAKEGKDSGGASGAGSSGQSGGGGGTSSAGGSGDAGQTQGAGDTGDSGDAGETGDTGDSGDATGVQSAGAQGANPVETLRGAITQAGQTGSAADVAAVQSAYQGVKASTQTTPQLDAAVNALAQAPSPATADAAQKELDKLAPTGGGQAGGTGGGDTGGSGDTAQ